MAVLVSGGAGFIGSNLVDELMTQGSEVLVLDNLSEGKLEYLLRWKNHLGVLYPAWQIRLRR